MGSGKLGFRVQNLGASWISLEGGSEQAKCRESEVGRPGQSQAERVAEQEAGSKISAWRASHGVDVTR